MRMLTKIMHKEELEDKDVILNHGLTLRLKHDSLEPFGFITSEKGYELRKPLMAEGLEARLFIDLEGKLTGQVVDIDFDES